MAVPTDIDQAAPVIAHHEVDIQRPDITTDAVLRFLATTVPTKTTATGVPALT